MIKEFHLYMRAEIMNGMALPGYCHGYDETNAAIERGDECINTTQVMLCTTDLLARGYRIFVHTDYSCSHEIKLGANESTTREIKMGHDLPKLIVAGEFNTNKS